MAFFPKRLFESLSSLNPMSQLLIVANNVQGITEAERKEIIQLSASEDPRVVSAIDAFKLDKNTENLIACWRAIIQQESVAPAGMDEPLQPQTKGLRIDVKPPSEGQGSSQRRTPRNKFKKAVRVAQVANKFKRTTTKSSGSPLLSPRVTGAATSAAAPLSEKDIVVLRDKLGLGLVHPRTFISQVNSLLQKRDSISKADFTNLILGLSKSKEGFHKLKQQQSAELLFDFLDGNGNGELEREEILNSLVVVLGGSPEEKIEAAFLIYDIDGNGLISFEEMLKHQTAVFKMIFSMKPELHDSCRENPESLALITTENLFQEMDENGDRVLTLAEFKAWYKRETANTEELKAEKQARLAAAEQSKLSAAESVKKMRESLTSVDRLQQIQMVKDITGLGTVHVMDALELFKKYNTTGFFSRQQFYDILREIITNLAGMEIDEPNFNQVAADIYLRFDIDGNGVVDLGEVFSGMSLLCAGNVGDKLKAACYVFDDSGDGRMQFEEVKKYFHATFQLVMQNAGASISTDKLSQVTATNLFTSRELDLETGSVTYEDLLDWIGKTLSKFL